MDRYTLEYCEQYDYFMAIPLDEHADAFVLCGDTEQEARDFAARTGVELI